MSISTSHMGSFGLVHGDTRGCDISQSSDNVRLYFPRRESGPGARQKPKARVQSHGFLVSRIEEHSHGTSKGKL